MDSRRDFTRQLLQKLGGDDKRPARMAGPKPLIAPPPYPGAPQPKQALRVLAVTDSTSSLSLPTAREVLSLGRFGVTVQVLADERVAEKLRRVTPAADIQVLDSSLPSGTLGYVRALVAAASPDLLAKAALGMGDTLTACAVQAALWQNVPVYMDFTVAQRDIDGHPCQNKFLLATLDGYVKQLCAMGVHAVKRGEILPVLLAELGLDICGKEATLPAREEVLPTAEKRMFITRRDVERYTGGVEWRIPPNAVVTAEARDAAARRGIDLRRQNSADPS